MSLAPKLYLMYIGREDNLLVNSLIYYQEDPGNFLILSNN